MQLSRLQMPLLISALGVVFGDIGTSPLYAFRETLHELTITPDNILGILSLIFWTFILVISLKYILLILRADNNGEGGVLALYALLRRKKNSRRTTLLIAISILGASLLFSDGILTPAVSVLSAIEGLKTISPHFSHLVEPLTVLVLLLLFWGQRKGTGSIGGLFGPMMLVWFIAIGGVGLYRILDNALVMQAINPYYALHFFMFHKFHSYLVLSGVFLVITGGEALYADIGHFGKSPIRASWFVIVLPSLVLNYFGQGAFLLANPQHFENPFYDMLPHWLSLPMLVLATIATIIASQAVISATFSLAMQAISLDFMPKLRLIQTSVSHRGQIYVPFINIILAVCTITLVLTFKTSSHLASAYGLAVNLVMITVTMLVLLVAFRVWHWSFLKSCLIFLPFLLIDSLFLIANFRKINSGAWIPLLLALGVALIMITWLKGIEYLKHRYFNTELDLKEFEKCENITPFDALCLADPYDKSGNSFIKFLSTCQQKPRLTLILNIEITDQPYVQKLNQFALMPLSSGCYRLTIYYGFSQTINIPRTLNILKQTLKLPFHLDLKSALYFVEQTKMHVTHTRLHNMFYWQKKLFGLLIYNVATDLQYYHLPFEHTVIIGNYCEI